VGPDTNVATYSKVMVSRRFKVGSTGLSYCLESSYSVVASGMFLRDSLIGSEGHKSYVLTLWSVEDPKTHLEGLGTTSKFRLSTS
jgi:hypothetical protein